MSYGYSCCNGGWVGTGCENTIDSEPGESHHDLDVRAAKAGWVIGHYDGQGHYACPECKDTIFDAVPLTPISTE